MVYTNMASTTCSCYLSMFVFWSFSILNSTGIINTVKTARNATLQNASDDVSRDLLPPDVQPTIKVALTTCNGLLLLGALLGNILVIHVVRSNLRMRTTTNILILNMAVSDLLIALIFIPSQTMRLFVGSAWHAGTVGMVTCKVVMSSRLVSVACSTLSLVAIAIDRYYAVAQPLRRRARQTSHKKTWAVCVIWLLSLLICIPPISFYKLITMTNGNVYCTAVFVSGPLGKAYILGGFVVTFVVPLLIITVLYIIVGFKLYRRNLPGPTKEMYKERILHTSRRVTKMMMTVVIAFAVCMLPVQIYLFNRFYNNSVMSSNGLFWGFTLTAFISNLNTFLNPCLYVIFNEKFRKGFKKALFCNKEAVLFIVTSGDSKAVYELQITCQTVKTGKLDATERKENRNREKNGTIMPYIPASHNQVTLTTIKTLDTN